MSSVLIKPIITEKLTLLQEQKNQYAFEISRDANKIQVANAIEKKFNVKVSSVRTSISKGKRKSQFTKKGRKTGFRSDSKRAFVTLAKDNKIDFFEAS